MSDDDASEEQTPTCGDYLHGESAIYVVTDRRPDECKIEVVAELRHGHRGHGPYAAEGWQPAAWVESYTLVDGEVVNSLSVSSGDKLRFENGTLDRNPATAVVDVTESGEISLESEGGLVPDGFDSMLALKSNIVSMDLDHERGDNR